MKHVYCHFAKVIFSFTILALKNFKDISVGLLSCTSQSCQASLPPRQKLHTNALNAWLETRRAPSPFCGNGMTPTARKWTAAGSPPPLHRTAQSGEMINTQVKIELLDLLPAGPSSAAVPVNAVHSFSQTPFQGVCHEANTLLICLNISIAAPGPHLSLLQREEEVNLRGLFWFYKINCFQWLQNDVILADVGWFFCNYF